MAAPSNTVIHLPVDLQLKADEKAELEKVCSALVPVKKDGTTNFRGAIGAMAGYSAQYFFMCGRLLELRAGEEFVLVEISSDFIWFSLTKKKIDIISVKSGEKSQLEESFQQIQATLNRLEKVMGSLKDWEIRCEHVFLKDTPAARKTTDTDFMCQVSRDGEPTFLVVYQTEEGKQDCWRRINQEAEKQKEEFKASSATELLSLVIFEVLRMISEKIQTPLEAALHNVITYDTINEWVLKALQSGTGTSSSSGKSEPALEAEMQKIDDDMSRILHILVSDLSQKTVDVERSILWTIHGIDKVMSSMFERMFKKQEDMGQQIKDLAQQIKDLARRVGVLEGAIARAIEDLTDSTKTSDERVAASLATLQSTSANQPASATSLPGQ